MCKFLEAEIPPFKSMFLLVLTIYNYSQYRSCEQSEGRAVEQEAHIEGALAAEASLVILDTLESIVQADGGGGT